MILLSRSNFRRDANKQGQIKVDNCPELIDFMFSLITTDFTKAHQYQTLLKSIEMVQIHWRFLNEFIERYSFALID